MSNHDEDNTKFEDEVLPEGVVLKEHSYDGIREYDQRLPRWWLLTLYGAIIFSGLYWLVDHNYMKAQSTTEQVEQELSEIATIKLANSIDVTDNALFWEMSENAAFVTAGKVIYDANCTPCHGANLEGGIGFSLVDGEWVHGAQPSSIYNTIYDGVPDKGMQAWGTLLGQKRITEVVAYVLSKNDRSTMEAGK
ncbi:cbb3-type cytochrome c oxidase N-terminal domain-containing protein [Rubellicoccus peritrichatus]|uniref:Cbb3-type cytochrome c oxidase N-terminal domain-containing protein n=1 Tax=Rubellicoccus peritrichatus TaxID=3080537 RepID=A0AAQ3QUS1_9BACT|nr:cbb3-type cytochrome c oxidase N-terminal domain-containing protein [Puniceicoccus sp. CR14]WOO40215.1 cbb3-type cytochrome c oxidase N-terminal domain-containing protein [Puniceicoccus sp. CR14]